MAATEAATAHAVLINLHWCDPDFLHAASASFECAAFCKESRMKFASATELHRKSRGTWGSKRNTLAFTNP
jgi:hypothetical protein